tara:strand:- start:50 stop:319 length:270 start_codon:yes stop_codon:yes gene_type:complete
MSFLDDPHDVENKPRYVPTDRPGLIRDTETYAILSTDRKALMNYRKKREQLKETKAKLDNIDIVEKEIDGLKSDMEDIKDLLQKLLKEQ